MPDFGTGGGKNVNELSEVIVLPVFQFIEGDRCQFHFFSAAVRSAGSGCFSCRLGQPARRKTVIKARAVFSSAYFFRRDEQPVWACGIETAFKSPDVGNRLDEIFVAFHNFALFVAQNVNLFGNEFDADFGEVAFGYFGVGNHRFVKTDKVGFGADAFFLAAGDDFFEFFKQVFPTSVSRVSISPLAKEVTMISKAFWRRR